MEFQLSCFKSWKMMLWKGCTQYASKFGKLSSSHKDWKRSVFISIPKKGNAKECSIYRTIALISHASKVMLKILQARLQAICEPWTSQMFKLVLEKAEETEIKLPTSAGSLKKQESSKKISISGGSDGKVSVYNAGDLGPIPESGRSAREGNGNPLQYCCLKNPMGRGAW